MPYPPPHLFLIIYFFKYKIRGPMSFLGEHLDVVRVLIEIKDKKAKEDDLM